MSYVCMWNLEIFYKRFESFCFVWCLAPVQLEQLACRRKLLLQARQVRFWMLHSLKFQILKLLYASGCRFLIHMLWHWSWSVDVQHVIHSWALLGWVAFFAMDSTVVRVEPIDSAAHKLFSTTTEPANGATIFYVAFAQMLGFLLANFHQKMNMRTTSSEIIIKLQFLAQREHGLMPLRMKLCLMKVSAFPL